MIADDSHLRFLSSLELLHVLLALTSGIGFALRGFVRKILDRPFDHAIARIGPHVLDSFLLATGIALWAGYRYNPLVEHWLGLKLALLLIYIALGFAPFRIERRDRAVLAYLAALGAFLGVASLATLKPI